MSSSFSSSILRSREVDILTTERHLAHELEECLRIFESSAEDAQTLRGVTDALQEPFLLVVAGEFNAGKSAFINAMIGEKVLEEGVTPTTAHVTLLRHGETSARHLRPDEIEEVWHPATFLRDTAIVDTPGTNAVLRHHEQLTSEFVPRSDFVLFVTSADRPFTESERLFMERIRNWGKKIVVVVNKIDLLRTNEDVAEVIGFVRQHATTLLGSTPDIFPISSRLAQEGRQAHAGDAGIALYEQSRMGALRDYLLRTLDDSGRTHLKLLTPLGVMQRLLVKYVDAAEQRRALLEEDARTVANIETQVAEHYAEMERAFEQRVRVVDDIVAGIRARGDVFLDGTVRLTNVAQLLRREAVRARFEQEVVADAPQEIETAVHDLIDWIVGQEHRLWQDVNEYITRRRQASSALAVSGGDEHVLGGIGATFDYNRRSTLQKVATSASRTLQSYDRSTESAELANSLQGAVAQTALAGAAGVGLGVGVVVLVGTTAADITGITAGIALAVLGLAVLPLHKSRAKSQLDSRTRELAERVKATLCEQFSREVTADKQRLAEALAPYSRFVKLETERVGQVRETLDRLRDEAAELRKQVDGVIVRPATEIATQTA
jgi:small GTP-binding protein